jgi:glycosyltransferase involved in cell wall biosynthesis
MGSGVCAVIPTIPPRRALLTRALASVFNQTVQPDAIAVVVDNDHAGVWVTRSHGVQMARTPWIAFLDDDDEWLPHHLERLLARQAETGADLVYPCFEGGPAAVRRFCGKPFNQATMATVTITVLVRTELAAQIPLGPPNPGEINANDDHRLLCGVLDAGGTVAHLPEETWRYNLHDQHTSGQPSRW